MEDLLLQDEQGRETEGETNSPKQLSVEWAQSEWFEIYLRMARRKQGSSEKGVREGG